MMDERACGAPNCPGGDGLKVQLGPIHTKVFGLNFFGSGLWAGQERLSGLQIERALLSHRVKPEGFQPCRVYTLVTDWVDSALLLRVFSNTLRSVFGPSALPRLRDLTADRGARCQPARRIRVASFTSQCYQTRRNWCNFFKMR